MKQLFTLLLCCCLLAFASCGNGFKKGENDVAQADTTQLQMRVPDSCTYELAFGENPSPVITATVVDGVVSLDFNHQALVENGMVSEEQYQLPDAPVEVGGLSGRCVGVHIGDIGQDYNPILCMLMDDGTVDIVSLWDMMRKGDFEAAPIHFTNIVDFRNGGGGPEVSEEGDTIYAYVTIYGIDKDGVEHEVPLYLLDYNLQHLENGVNCEFQLTQDWGLGFTIGKDSEVIDEQYLGHFWPISQDWEKSDYEYGYEMTSHMNFASDENIGAEDVVSIKGVFRMHANADRSYDITPVEGLNFGAKTLGRAVRYQVMQDSEY